MIVAFIAELADLPADRVDPNATLADDLGLDSISVAELMTMARTRLGIVVDDDAVGGSMTVRDVVDRLSVTHAGGVQP
jgi:acyl carrier protein